MSQLAPSGRPADSRLADSVVGRELGQVGGLDADSDPQWCAAWVRAAEAEAGWDGAAASGVWLDDLMVPTVRQLREAAEAMAVDAALNDVEAGQRRDSGVNGGTDVDPNPGEAPDQLAQWVRREWWSAPIRAEVRRLMLLQPGLGLIAALSELHSGGRCPADHRHPDAEVEAADPSPVPGSVPGHPCACQLIVAAAWQAVESWVQVGAAASLVDAAGAEPVVTTPVGFARAQATDACRAELAPVLHLSAMSVHGRLANARDLHDFPALSELASSGLMFTSSWRVVLYETANLPPDARARVVQRVVESVLARHAADRRPWTAGETRQAVKRAIAAVAAAEAAEARTRAQARRRVAVTPAEDGMAWLSAYIRDVDAHRIYNRLTSAAAAAGADDPDDQRSTDERRADAMVVALLTRHRPAPPAAVRTPSSAHSPANVISPAVGTPSEPRPEICVVVSLATLLGCANTPAEVPGLGPIDADVARALAADGRWRWWVTDPASGRVAVTGSRTYAPSVELARLIRARESHCRMPGCARRAELCDLDHTTPYPQGPTTASNLGPLCRAHHNLKTHHGYSLANDPTAEGQRWIWTFPSGLTHTDKPDPPLPGP